MLVILQARQPRKIQCNCALIIQHYLSQCGVLYIVLECRLYEGPHVVTRNVYIGAYLVTKDVLENPSTIVLELSSTSFVTRWAPI